MRIALAMASYKRPLVAKRFLDSIYWPLAGAVVLAQPEDATCTATFRFPVTWLCRPPMNVGAARNLAAAYAIEYYTPDVLWISDDDIIATAKTKLMPSLVAKLAQPDTGLIVFTRETGQATWTDEVIPVNICNLGVGALVRVDVWKEIGGFALDANDEDGISLRTYLAGYRNYRARNCLVIHRQGGHDGGGLAQAIQDQHMAFEHTPYVDDELLIGKVAHMTYKGNKSLWRIKRGARFSAQAHALHAAQRKAKGFEDL